MRFLFAVLLTVQLAACGSQPAKESAAPLSAAPAMATVTAANSGEANLTRIEAEQRAAMINNVKYQLAIDISQPGESFSANEKIDFAVIGTPQNTFLDFKEGGKIISFTINGDKVQAQFANHRLAIPASKLKTGANTIEIQYEQSYSHTGRGLHKFTDPEDKRVYLYTQFEAYDAHQMFPSFDQPDMKGTMTMTVTAPKTWEVITTTRETAKTTAGQTSKWTFPESPIISTYLFSLHAGPYAKWESRAGNIPLRLFARQTLKKYVVINEWFPVTQQGLKFFGDYFAYPYPFKKYDQIIVPEFNAGAMENVAAITFSERFVHRSASTAKERESLQGVLLHEMAHMWFGDLVTMKWWNGLWLNESFATYMAALALAEATEFKNAWVSFYTRKPAAYVPDQQVTTHPIEADIPDTQSAFANFDGITYTKGASVLKQLAFYLGEDKFRAGVRHYFKTYAYKNTRLQDFMGALEQASGKDLKPWSKTWLEMAGVDTVRAEYSCDKGKVTNFALTLKGPNDSVSPRVHRTNVSLFSEQAGKVAPFKTENVVYQGSRTEVPQLVGVDCPLMVEPNAGDQDYVKVSYDSRTLEATKMNLAKISDVFARVMIWPNLFSMVRDVTLPPQEYLELAERYLPNETDLTIVEPVLSAIPAMIYYLPESDAVEKQARTAQVQKIERMLWAKINDPKTPLDLKKMILRTYPIVVESSEGRDQLVALLNGKTKIAGVPLDLDQKWSLLHTLAALGDQRMQPLLAKLKQVDTSDRGVDSAMAVEAAQPSLAIKEVWLKRLVEQKDLSYTQKRAIFGSLLPRTQMELRASLSDRYFQTLPDLAKTRELNFASLYSESLMPVLCTQSSAERLGKFVAETGSKLPVPVLKGMRVGYQEDGRCVSIRAFASANKSQR